MDCGEADGGGGMDGSGEWKVKERVEVGLPSYSLRHSVGRFRLVLPVNCIMSCSLHLEICEGSGGCSVRHVRINISCSGDAILVPHRSFPFNFEES